MPQHTRFSSPFSATFRPDRLKGSSIPLGARIIAAADFFDRTFARQQGADAIDVAWRRLQDENGRKLDPAICRIIEKHIRTAYAKKAPKTDRVEVELAINALQEGMVLSKDVRSGTGLLLLSRGMTIAEKNIQALKRYSQLDPFKGGVYVWAKK